MLKLYFVETFFRGIPEMFLIILGIYIVTKQTLNRSKWIFSSILMAILTYGIRLLPIYFGVHMILIIVLLVSIMVIGGIPIIKSIYGTFLMYFCLSISEFLNLLILNLLNIDASLTNMEPLKKSLLGIPSLIILAILILLFRFLIKMKEGKKND